MKTKILDDLEITVSVWDKSVIFESRSTLRFPQHVQEHSHRYDTQTGQPARFDETRSPHIFPHSSQTCLQDTTRLIAQDHFETYNNPPQFQPSCTVSDHQRNPKRSHVQKYQELR
jgi:hypothetical protein